MFNISGTSAILLATFFALQNAPAFAWQAQQFSIPTTDGKTTITGEIDYPDAATEQPGKLWPTVVMIPGTGLFDRDVNFGASGTPRDLIFRDLAEQFTAAGIAVARMDYRGVRCNKFTMPPCPDCDTQAKKRMHFYKSCFLNEIRKDVTTANIEDDILSVYNFTRAQPSVDHSRLAIFAHSEGTFHIARLIGRNRVHPRGLLLMGLAAESPVSIIHWQLTGRPMKIFDWDVNFDDKLTSDEINTGWASDRFFHGLGVTIEQLLSPEGFWLKSELEKMHEDDYKATAEDAIAIPDNAPWPEQKTPDDVIMASQQWWKWFFTDHRSTLDDLVQFDGQIIVHNGTFDSQTPGDRELGFVQARAAEFKLPPKCVLHPGVGHGMSPASPTYGPLDETVRASMVEDLKSLLLVK